MKTSVQCFRNCLNKLDSPINRKMTENGVFRLFTKPSTLTTLCRHQAPQHSVCHLNLIRNSKIPQTFILHYPPKMCSFKMFITYKTRMLRGKLIKEGDLDIMNLLYSGSRFRGLWTKREPLTPEPVNQLQR